MKKNTLIIKIIFIYLILILVLLGLYVFSNKNVEKINIGYNSREYKENATVENLEVGENAIIASSQITNRKTGVGPFDAETETDSQTEDGTIKWTAGNDVSENDNIVRSFDQITWTIDNVMALKEDATEEYYTGGVIEIKGEIPENCENFVKWDLDSMLWAENPTISADGRTFTAQYSMIETEMTVPGKQTLVAVLKVFGAPNGLEIVPTFSLNLLGNDESDVQIITDMPVIVSAAPKYNIELMRNTSLSNKTTVDLDGDGKAETEGRMYGYGLVLQLCNTNSNKALKGIEYPDGEINFDIDLKLERTKIGSTEREDITDECMPILWNYKWNANTATEIIANRSMNFGSKTTYHTDRPYGIRTSDRSNSTYNSGNIKMIQNDGKINTTISNYEFDNIFPTYPSYKVITTKPIYGENKGCFSVGYFQIFVPDNEASTSESRNYYLTVADSNFFVKSISGKETRTQQIASDDSITVQHVLHNPSSYGHYMFLPKDGGGYLGTSYETGDGKATRGQCFEFWNKFYMGTTNDYDIYSAIKFIKFDGDCIEPLLYSDGSKYKLKTFDGKMRFNVWYITKKDGTNWSSQTEMNNANIEDMLYFENIEDIPEGYICVGEYFESNNNGNLARSTGNNNTITIRLKIKETAEIGRTYGLTALTKMWLDYVDRNLYSITKQNFNQWPKETWSSGNRNYIKTEYDENGNMIPGTHSGGWGYGQSILIVGSNLSLTKTSIDESTNEKKVNYDIGRNEYDVTYKLTPSLPANQYSSATVGNITLQVKDTLPKGLTYVSESCEHGEPEIIENSDGSTTLVWYIYNCTIGEAIDPITYKAHINEESENGTQYETVAIVSEVIGTDGISKVGNTQIDTRTAKTSIQVINLASYSLYQRTDTSVIEREGVIHYKIVSHNKGSSEIKDLKILDILPYNGDGRGTKVTPNANMTIQKIELTKTSSGQNISCDNMKIYMSENEESRNETTETINLEDGKWKEVNVGETVENPCSAIAVNGVLEGNTKLEIDIYLKTNGNEAQDKYVNMATDKADSSIPMQTAVVTTSVVDRVLDGYVWYDEDGNGKMEESERKLSGIKVDLVGENGEEVLNAIGEKMPQAVTDENGYYEFKGIAKGNYKVKVDLSQIENLEIHRVTNKITEVAVDPKITSKFNEDGYTDVITKLNETVTSILEERNVNLGITLKDAQVQVQLYDDTTKELITEKTIDGKITKQYDVTETRNKIIPPYYEIIPEKTEGNETGTFALELQTVKYYCKYKNYPYTIKYLEKDTNKELATAKTGEQGYSSTVTESAIDIKGYDKVDEAEKSITIGLVRNEITFYYTKRADLSYTVKYLDEDTDEEIADEKIVNDQVFADRVTEQAIEISGYNKVDPTEQTIAIDVEDNLIKFYYTKRTDLSYTVKYLEQDADEDDSNNQVLHDEKVVTGQTFKSTVTENAIDIEGYNKVEPISNTITIGVSGNEITFYYTKRIDLSYTVKYLEKDTEKQLAEPKTVEGQTFKSRVTESAIDIDGYNKVVPTDATITIEVSGNEITFYYTKRADLSYTVKYFEKGTNNELSLVKVVPNQTFETVIDSNSEVITIDGFKFDSCDKDSLTITTNTENNVINIFYTRVTGLSYTVNYLEKGTNEVVNPQKVDGEQTFGNKIIASNEVIEIDGYNYDSRDKEEITITTGENVLNLYYTKRTDLSYIVKYLEQGTNTELLTAKTVNGQTFKASVTENAIDIEGYDKVGEIEKTITIKTSGNEIIFYYAKRTDLTYTVKYLEKDTNKELLTTKTVNNQVFESEITENAIDIEGYDKVDPTTVTINIAVSGNEITFYYTKRTDLSYTVKYLEQDTNKILHEAKVVENQVFGTEITEEAIDIQGYNKVDPIEGKITIGVNTNEITFYYTKRTNLSYTVKYLEKDNDEDSTNNRVLHEEKIIPNQIFESEVTESAIDIEGYNKDAPTDAKLTIQVSGNEIVFYYTKRSDLSYTVKYLEKDTNTELATTKTVNNQVFESEIIESAIEIEGYDKVEPNQETITIAVSGNEIVFYYTKRSDLSYTVKYLEQGTNTELAEEKVVSGQVFESKVTEQAIDIKGYNKVDPIEDTITIRVNGNEIIFYYTKRADLNYTVKYLDEDTEEEIADEKVVNNQVFTARVTEQAIDVEGYNKVAPTEQTIAIDVEDNLIKFYYTKRNDLSYTVKYLEKDTNVELHIPKTVNGQTFKSTATESAIDIDGYNKVEPISSTKTIEVSENEITFYYTKRTDLSYIVNYLEKDSNKVLATQKVINDQIFGTVINAKDEVIEIDGYNFDSTDKDEITISTKENTINVYYTKVTGLTYKVNYLDKATNEVISPAKVQGEQVFENVINATDEVIEVEGYNYSNSDKETITITTGENVLNLYYTKRTDLSYVVHYVEQDTNKKLADDKNVSGRIFKEEVTESAIEIEGYDKVAPTDEKITIEVSKNEITFYYTKRTDLSYTVKYLEKDTSIELASAKIVGDQVFESEVKEEAINIEGYDKIDPTQATIKIAVSGNEITFYYTKRADLSYTVKYLEKDSNIELATEKVIENQVFESEVTEEAIDIEGYNKVDPTSQTIVIEVEGNEITFYYTKRADLSYTVKYLDEDTDEEIADEKIVNNQVFADRVTESAIEIPGYNKVDPTEQTIAIDVEGNLIKFYYTKRTDLSYTVKYLEQDTNEKVAEEKVENRRTFQEIITETAIDVEGYNKVDLTEKSIVIAVEGNEIVFYYTKKADLSYTVKYLDEDTEEEIAQSKVIENQVFRAKVTEEAIDIEGYNKVDPTSQTIVIAVSGNEIIFYYTKRTDLSYTVKYLEQDTNLEVAESKTVGNKTLKETVTESAIDVDGYNKVDSLDKSIEIAVSGNEIIFYYTKKADLSYTVKYLEKDTNNKLAEEKIVADKIFQETVVEQAITIDGYNAENPTEKSIVIATSGNEITFYYTKRTDLSYVVNYLEKDTNIVLKESKTVDGQTFGTVIDTVEEKVAISGYDFDSIDKNQLTITTNLETNVINIFYTKGKFNYTVEYYYDNEIDSSKTATIEATFQDVIENYEDKNIPGYKLVNVEGLPLTVTEFPVMNVIKVYYVKDIFEYSVNYYYDEVLAPEKTEVSEGVFGTTIDTYKDKVEYGYELDRVENLPLTISKEPTQNVISVFYRRKDAQVVVKYVDKATGEEIAEETIKEEKVFDNFDVMEDQKDIEGYTLIEAPKEATGRFEEEPQERTFYYAKNTKVIVKYLEKDTDEVVYPEIIIEGYEGKDYTTVEQNVENYTCVDNSGELNGKMTRDEITVIYYYLQNTKVVVNHIDQISSDILATEEQAGLVGDEYTSSAKDFAGYVLVEKPENETVTMTKDVITLNYYYKKVSAGVIEKHIDIKTNELLDSTLYEGNEGDSYTTNEKSFYGYDIVADQMPENAEGEMTVEVIEVRYYYIRKASVKVEYLDKATGKTINETYQLEERDSTEYIRGYEGDPYKTVEKQFTGYDIVPELYPTNAEGIMQVIRDKNGNIVVDDSGNAVTETVVRYYYAYKTEVKERHIDVKTGEVLQEVTYKGHEGEDYSTSSKEIQGYDLVENQLPANAKGKMTVDTITVDYYYIKNITVRVEYIDVITNETITEKAQVPGKPGIYTDKDSTEIIKGHEGDEYKTTEKVFENYTIVKDRYPANWQGVMEMTIGENGRLSTETVVRYYYVHVSNGVAEKHIDAITGKELETETRYQGNEGDLYKTSSKEFKGYDLVTSRLPENAEGKMTKDEIVVKYYYIRKANVTIQYLEENTNNKIEADKVIEGHEGERYYAEGKNIAGYEFVRTVGEKDGVLGKENIIVKYYYKKIQTQTPNNNTNTTPAPTVQQKPSLSLKDLPDTGDMLPFITGGVILLVAMANAIISIINKKRKNK